MKRFLIFVALALASLSSHAQEGIVGGGSLGGSALPTTLQSFSDALTEPSAGVFLLAGDWRLGDGNKFTSANGLAGWQLNNSGVLNHIAGGTVQSNSFDNRATNGATFERINRQESYAYVGSSIGQVAPFPNGFEGPSWTASSGGGVTICENAANGGSCWFTGVVNGTATVNGLAGRVYIDVAGSHEVEVLADRTFVRGGYLQLVETSTPTPLAGSTLLAADSTSKDLKAIGPTVTTILNDEP